MLKICARIWLGRFLCYNNGMTKSEFRTMLASFADSVGESISDNDGQWTIKGFVDVCHNVYTISADTKVISKILEIHMFPHLLDMAKNHGFSLVLPQHQNYYPDASFVLKKNPEVRYALDFKTTYRSSEKPWMCNGFTLGSHGKYFRDRNSGKNIQFPYASYAGHFCLGIIYDRTDESSMDESKVHSIADINSVASVISNIQLFVAEKWKIAGDKRGSSNTANIGSVKRIADMLDEKGMFSRLGEEWFDDYWMNYGKITVQDDAGNSASIKSLHEFVKYRKGDVSKIVPRETKQ